MAKFDVYRTRDGWTALDCQSDFFDTLNTRLTVPLMPPEQAPIAAKRLNPRFVLDDQELVMVTQFAASVPVAELREQLGSLVDHEYEIGAALDMLISGY